MKNKKITQEEIYERIADYLIKKYGKDAITKYSEIYILLKRFGLRREIDYNNAIKVLEDKYHKKFNFIFLFKPFLLFKKIVK